MRSSTRAIVGFLLGLNLTAAATSGEAQTTLTPQQLEQLREQMRNQPGRGMDIPDEPDPSQAETARMMNATTGPLLDRPISRTEYRLGPGDRLIVSIFGYRNQLFPLVVTPEGSVIIPTVGIVRVVGLNLDQATQRARQRVRQFYPESEVDVSLAAVRSFRVFVVGAVPEPGARTVTAVTRVSEIVPAVSGGDVIYRNILLRRNDESLRIDLARFRRTGDVAHNPFLQEGDVVHVPTVDQTVTIRGQVAYPGTYEFRPAETLANLISIANGGSGFMSMAADTLLLMRFTNDPRGEIHAISRYDAAGELGSRMVLEPLDAIFVPRLGDRTQTSATLQGEVVRPGRYPIQPGVTTIRELVEMAGGFTPEASLSEAVLQRRAREIESETSRPLANIPPEFLTRDELRILQVVSRSDEQNVVVDISSASVAYDLPVNDGDVLFVPRRREEVVVLGAVRRPGLVVHQDGLSLDQFIQSVGGYTRQADVGAVVVVRSRSGARLRRRDLDSVEPGDQIIVPFRERTTFLERVQTAQGVINTVSGVVLTIVGLERLWAVLR